MRGLERFLGVVVCAAIAACDVAAQQQVGKRRALLVGINDYSASTLGPKPKIAPPPERDWVNLGGAVNDVAAMKDMLVLLYGFERQDIVTLTDQAATRDAILHALETHLHAPASRADTLFFFFGGHGSQVRNTRSRERDQLDETLVPADSRLGVRDIHDKELRSLFNRILDRGARLTVLLDNCHSGSGARGPEGTHPRGIKSDPRNIADGTAAGLAPEDRGALILSAAQDFDKAWETRDEQGNLHGAFSWAWLRSMRESSPGESAAETFLRAAAHMRAETPYQEPVLAGRQARLIPFLGSRRDRAGNRIVVGVERVLADGTVMLQGGWAAGLSVGTELRVLASDEAAPRLRVTAIRGLGQSEARLAGSATVPPSVRTGALLEVIAWAAPTGRPLRVWIPRTPGDAQTLRSLARRLAEAAAVRSIRWLNDPTEAPPTHVLRHGGRAWELLGPGKTLERLGPKTADALAGIARIGAGSSLFVQFAAPAAWIDGVDAPLALSSEGIVTVPTSEDADYVLTGRYSARRLDYAWMRTPAVSEKASLPLRTTWIAEEGTHATSRDTPLALRAAALRLQRIHAWHLLESPEETRWPYRLALKRESNGEWAAEAMQGGETYSIALRATATMPRLATRYVYVFVIDAHGKSVLLFPQRGSVENRFPLDSQAPAPAEIALGAASAFAVAPPYGVDTYFLLSTDEPLPNPWILEWDSARTRSPRERSALQELLESGSRGRRRSSPPQWSIEKLVLESVPPPPPKTRRR